MRAVINNVIHALSAKLERDSRYRERRAEVAAFNAQSPVLINTSATAASSGSVSVSSNNPQFGHRVFSPPINVCGQ